MRRQNRLKQENHYSNHEQNEETKTWKFSIRRKESRHKSSAGEGGNQDLKVKEEKERTKKLKVQEEKEET